MAPGPLLWTLALIAGSWAQDLWVSQPGSVQGTEGGSVTLPCSYNSTREPRLGSYTWVKEVAGARLELSDGTQEFRGRVSRAQDRSFLRERRADVELRDLRPYDTGTYRCLVKIPTLGEGAGNGTWLQVLKAEPTDVKPDGFVLLWLFLRGLICTFGLAAGALGTSLCYQRKLSRRRQRRVRERQSKAQLRM
ncbi:natural cytotoxicity triggering receptor 3-like [Terrapene carolina triunguis]|uniref:natural cytotoxicity triggering receptor 3 n=1 Tax=Terrapene triunguis TaxID=2587831 RepID=UPI000E7773BF|nr:natural cytotoxicity triggering receptor 3 [Terrapene carolina triunguis]XP_026502875.1 natural cytotoxicity triggering receptor 3-like [Terrapene carolina triunguis]